MPPPPAVGAQIAAPTIIKDTVVPSSTAAPMHADGYINLTEYNGGFIISVPFGTSQAAAGDTMNLKLGGSTLMTRVLTAADASAGTATFSVPPTHPALVPPSVNSVGLIASTSLTVVFAEPVYRDTSLTPLTIFNVALVSDVTTGLSTTPTSFAMMGDNQTLTWTLAAWSPSAGDAIHVYFAFIMDLAGNTIDSIDIVY